MSEKKEYYGVPVLTSEITTSEILQSIAVSLDTIADRQDNMMLFVILLEKYSTRLSACLREIEISLPDTMRVTRYREDGTDVKQLPLLDEIYGLLACINTDIKRLKG